MPSVSTKATGLQHISKVGNVTSYIDQVSYMTMQRVSRVLSLPIFVNEKEDTLSQASVRGMLSVPRDTRCLIRAVFEVQFSC